MDAIFQKWCDKLLDTGKSNRLINYKDTKMRTIEILEPSSHEVFNKLSSGQTLNFYEIDDYIRSLKENELEDESTDGNLKDKGKFDRISKQKVVEALGNKLTKNEILSF